MKIIDAGHSGLIGVGLSASTVDLNRLPGWDENSLGYHSDDGNTFRGSGSGESYGPTCSTNDTVGLCLNLIDQTVTFTKNGVSLGVAFRDVSTFFPQLSLSLVLSLNGQAVALYCERGQSCSLSVGEGD